MSDFNNDESSPPGAAPAKARKPRKAAARKRATGSESAGKTLPPGTAAAAPAVVELTRLPLSVRWRDLDAFNHVNNSQYLSFLEEARLSWMMGLPGLGLEDDVAPVVAAATLVRRRSVGAAARYGAA